MDTTKFHEALEVFKYQASPHNTNSSAPCTVGDINNLIDKTIELMSVFMDSLENEK